MENYLKNSDPRNKIKSGLKVSDEAFRRALNHWYVNNLFSFDEVQAATTQSDYDQLMKGIKIPKGTSERQLEILKQRR